MPTTITGTDGVSQVQTGAVESGDLPAGSVIQVVQATFSTVITVSSTTYIDIGLSASITPLNSQNKILIINNLTGRLFTQQNDDRRFDINIVRDSTQIHQANTDFLQSGVGGGGFAVFPIFGSIVYLDSPDTVNTITYKTQGKVNNNSSTTRLQINSAASTSTITLMEIAG